MYISSPGSLTANISFLLEILKSGCKLFKNPIHGSKRCIRLIECLKTIQYLRHKENKARASIVPDNRDCFGELRRVFRKLFNVTPD